MDPPSEVVYRLAEDLHRRFRPPEQNWSFAQVPVIVRLLYGRTERASQEISLHVAVSRPSTLVHYVYDHQRAETGYEGDQRVTSQASREELHQMVTLVRRIVPAAGPARPW